MIDMPDTDRPTPLELVEALFPREIDMVEFVRSGGGLPEEVTGRIAPDMEIEFLPVALGGGMAGGGWPGCSRAGASGSSPTSPT